MNLLADLFLTFAKIGAFTFGGGYAMLSLIDHECVGKKKWITDEELEELTVIAESTPGPVAINCATYTGYKQRGVIGALCATVGMVLPSFLIIWLIASYFDTLLEYPIVVKAFAGIRVAVSILVMQAAVKLICKLLKKPKNRTIHIALVAIAFVVVLVLNLSGIQFSTIYLIVISGAFGYALYALTE